MQGSLAHSPYNNDIGPSHRNNLSPAEERALQADKRAASRQARCVVLLVLVTEGSNFLTWECGGLVGGHWTIVRGMEFEPLYCCAVSLSKTLLASISEF